MRLVSSHKRRTSADDSLGPAVFYNRRGEPIGSSPGIGSRVREDARSTTSAPSDL